MSTNKNIEGRLTGKWKPTVRVRRPGSFSSTLDRKVVTNGVKVLYASKLLDDAIELLRSGYEVQISSKKLGPCVRLFPLAATDLKSMHVATGAMTALSHSVKDIELDVANNERHFDKEEVEEMVKEIRDRYNERKKERVCVTPDTVVECPRCNLEIRVHKYLR